jgi:hypothetical protein
VAIERPAPIRISHLRHLVSNSGVRGNTLLPLYPKPPLAAQSDPALYALPALFDALRIGQAREREIARALLEERLK